LLPVGANVTSNSTISFNPTAFQVDVLKDIAVSGVVSGSGSVTDIGQQFTQVAPEPGSLGLAVIGFLLVAGKFCRAAWRADQVA
jgi:hypothetical protein